MLLLDLGTAYPAMFTLREIIKLYTCDLYTFLYAAFQKRLQKIKHEKNKNQEARDPKHLIQDWKANEGWRERGRSRGTLD